jgi:hypothetical protein
VAWSAPIIRVSALLGGGRTAGDAGVDEFHPAPGQLGRQRDRGLRRGRAQVDHHLAGPAAGQDPARTADDRLDHPAVRQREQHDVAAPHHLGHRAGRGGAALVGRGRVEVVAEHAMTGGDQAAGDPAAHVAEPDEADPPALLRRAHGTRTA